MLLETLTSLLAAAALAAAPYNPGTAAKGVWIYDLSDSSGPVPSTWASLAYDTKHHELYVTDRSDGSVGVFNDAGMEVYRFGADEELGTIVDVAPLEEGDLAVLASQKGRPVLWRCNFRGERKARISMDKLPPEFANGFFPDRAVARGKRLYLAERGAMKVAVLGLDGAVEETHDFFHQLELDKLKSARGGIPAMQAFNVDEAGNILFTVAPMFRAFIISPSGSVTSFGERGGSPGRFNVVGGITRDSSGRLIIGDVLRCVVMVFTPDLEFRGEFGGRGWGPGDLIAPLDVAFGNGLVFVSQSARRGVSVYRLTVQEPTAPPAPAPAAAR